MRFLLDDAQGERPACPRGVEKLFRGFGFGLVPGRFSFLGRRVAVPDELAQRVGGGADGGEG